MHLIKNFIGSINSGGDIQYHSPRHGSGNGCHAIHEIDGAESGLHVSTSKHLTAYRCLLFIASIP